MIPLECARQKLKEPKSKEINCYNCDKMVVIGELAYCEVSGKIIMSIHLDVNRENQCKDVFKERTGEIRREGS